MVKHLPIMNEIWVQSLGQEDLLEKEKATPFQYSFLENPMDGEAWQATYHGIAKSLSKIHPEFVLYFKQFTEVRSSHSDNTL